MRISLAVAVLVSMTRLSAPVANAQAWLDRPGVAGDQKATVGVSTITLPPGTWTQVEEDALPRLKENSIPVVRKGYLQIVGSRIISVVVVDVNAIPVKAVDVRGEQFGMQPPSSCLRRDVYYHDNPNEEIGTFDCLLVNHDTMTRSSQTPPWSVMDHAAAQYGGFPRPMIYAELSLTDEYHRVGLHARIYVDPGLAGFPTETGDWHDSAWQADFLTPSRRAYLDKVVAWARAYRPALKASLD